MSYFEKALLQKARRFDLKALEEIYDRYNQAIYRYAYRQLGDMVQAEDCVGETFLRFLQAVRHGKGPQDYLQAYLFRIAHNWITDQYRRQPPPPVELVDEQPDLGLIKVEDAYQTKFETESMRNALHHLTPEQRQVIMLRFVEDWSLQETAAAMEKEIGAVKALQHRAIETLAKVMKAKVE